MPLVLLEQSIDWRAFRFVEVEVMPGDEPCRLLDVVYRQTEFPQTLAAEFSSSGAPGWSRIRVAPQTD
ncbi:MAG: hypothetical protein ACREIA_24730 [Opitutaceae bacterium]